MDITLWIAVFFFGFMVDVMDVLWVYSCTEEKPTRAGWLSVIIGGCKLGGVVPIVGDLTLAIPYLAGLWLGSYVAVRWKMRQGPPPRKSP